MSSTFGLTPWPRADLKAIVNTRVPRLTRQRRSDDSAAIGKRSDSDHLSVTCSLQPSDRKRFAVSHDKAIDMFEIEDIPPYSKREPILVLAFERAVLV